MIEWEKTRFSQHAPLFGINRDSDTYAVLLLQLRACKATACHGNEERLKAVMRKMERKEERQRRKKNNGRAGYSESKMASAVMDVVKNGRTSPRQKTPHVSKVDFT
ncbi:hypothetical protein E2C01_042115 [Portunus trituberculatus]|uniref:Uncharacterized protein n=1 Tax=Portunus trituberculatus TaxID=210409 RepID=A0A5B7FS61_PORTR|nr:hypothetical protein [Portunus trituberculatus]